MNGNEKQKKWAVKYARQTMSIITTLERERKLSMTQRNLVNLIIDKIKIAFD
jgi:hypothetical protein